MEAITNISFHYPDEDAEHWQTILKGLSEQQWGATLQDRIDYFGTQAAEKLEEMLPKLSHPTFSPQTWPDR